MFLGFSYARHGWFLALGIQITFIKIQVWSIIETLQEMILRFMFVRRCVTAKPGCK